MNNKSVTIARVFLGLIFTVFGLNGFFQFLPVPPMPEPAGKLMGAFFEAGYMFPLIKGTEVVAGLMLLLGQFVPLALVALAPVVVNIALFHLFLAPDGMVMTAMIVALEAFLGFSYRKQFEGVLKRK